MRRGGDELAALRRRERDDPADVEHLPLDRSALQQAALFGGELLEPRSKQALDRGWDRDLVDTVLALREHREHLLEEKRIARRGRGDARTRLGREPCVRRQRRHQHRMTPHRRAGRAGRRRRSACRRPKSAACRAAPAGRGRRRGLRRREPSRPGARSGRATSARPSGCPRTRAPADVSRASASTSLRSAQKISSLTAPPMLAPIALSIRSATASASALPSSNSRRLRSPVACATISRTGQ